MYELWLMLNVVWEIALGAWPLLLGLVLAWLALVALAHRRGGRRVGEHQPWAMARGAALRTGLAAFALALVGLPYLTRASLSDIAYGADWLALAALALGCAVAAALFALPIARLMTSSTPHPGASS